MSGAGPPPLQATVKVLVGGVAAGDEPAGGPCSDGNWEHIDLTRRLSAPAAAAGGMAEGAFLPSSFHWCDVADDPSKQTVGAVAKTGHSGLSPSPLEPPSPLDDGVDVDDLLLRVPSTSQCADLSAGLAASASQVRRGFN